MAEGAPVRSGCHLLAKVFITDNLARSRPTPQREGRQEPLACADVAVVVQAEKEVALVINLLTVATHGREAHLAHANLVHDRWGRCRGRPRRSRRDVCRLVVVLSAHVGTDRPSAIDQDEATAEHECHARMLNGPCSVEVAGESSVD